MNLLPLSSTKRVEDAIVVIIFLSATIFFVLLSYFVQKYKHEIFFIVDSFSFNRFEHKFRKLKDKDSLVTKPKPSDVYPL